MPHSSLRVCTGERMAACFPSQSNANAEARSEFAGRSLNGKFPGSPDSSDIVNEQAVFGEDERIGKHTIIASEPTTYDEKEWNLIGANCALTVDEKGIETEVPIQYNPELNAEDPRAGPK